MERQGQASLWQGISVGGDGDSLWVSPPAGLLPDTGSGPVQDEEAVSTLNISVQEAFLSCTERPNPTGVQGLNLGLADLAQ